MGKIELTFRIIKNWDEYFIEQWIGEGYKVVDVASSYDEAVEKKIELIKRCYL